MNANHKKPKESDKVWMEISDKGISGINFKTTYMKNEMSIKIQKEINMNSNYSRKEVGFLNLKNSTRNLNTSIIHKIGHISKIKDQLCNWPPGRGRSPDTSRGHPNLLVFSYTIRMNFLE
ncbi:MAG: hypothetical protein JNK09_22060 [Prolixibacteraceae bacterium]|nr:hypothetical protein [Prolixibacteraceae bacterium]